MSVKIRLTRVGRKKVPIYKIVAANSRSPRDGKFLEIIGTYRPLDKDDNPNRFTINKERYTYWMNVGAQPTERVEYLVKKFQ